MQVQVQVLLKECEDGACVSDDIPALQPGNDVSLINDICARARARAHGKRSTTNGRSWYFKESALIDRSKYAPSETHTTCGWKGLFVSCEPIIHHPSSIPPVIAQPMPRSFDHSTPLLTNARS